MGLNLDLKSSMEDCLRAPGRTTAGLLAPVVAEEVTRRPLMVSSFDPAALQLLRAAAPRVPLGLLTWHGFPVDMAAAACAHMDVEVLALHVGSLAAGGQIDPGVLARLLSRLHRCGRQLLVWCPQTAGSPWSAPGWPRPARAGQPGCTGHPDPADVVHRWAARRRAGEPPGRLHLAGFEVDGSGMQLDQYDPLAKGLGLQYVLRGRFRDIWLHDTPATGFGCDFLQDTVVDAVLAERCGRQDDGEQPGGAGIGIGIGGWGTTELLTVTACTARGNGTNGIFVELEQQMWPPPRGIRITACHVEDNRFGISGWGADGLVVTGRTVIGNHEAGFDISAQGTAGMAGRGGMVVNCIIDGNRRDGIGIGNTPGPYTISGSRISANGRYGYWQHPLSEGHQGPAVDLVLDGNSIRDNGLDGIRVDAGLDHCAFTRNRIRNNGRRAAPATSWAGPASPTASPR